MKKFLVLGLVLLSSQVFAWNLFPVNPLIQATPFQVSAQFFNPYYEPISCSGYVHGMTVRGQNFSAVFNNLLVPGGQSRFAYVRTLPGSPFVNGWAQVNCHFLR
jgi:hypothetical protein